MLPQLEQTSSLLLVVRGLDPPKQAPRTSPPELVIQARRCAALSLDDVHMISARSPASRVAQAQRRVPAQAGKDVGQEGRVVAGEVGVDALGGGVAEVAGGRVGGEGTGGGRGVRAAVDERDVGGGQRAVREGRLAEQVGRHGAVEERVPAERLGQQAQAQQAQLVLLLGGGERGEGHAVRDAGDVACVREGGGRGR